MKFRNFLLMYLAMLAACGQEQHENINERKTGDKEQEFWVLYANADSICHVKRLVQIDTDYFLITSNINTAHPEAAHQTFISQVRVNIGDIAKLQSENSSFNWQPFKTTPLLFVQLKFSAFKDEMTALEKGHQLQGIIDDELSKKSAGFSNSLDTGPGGLNMLFNVSNVDAASRIIRSVLKQQGYDKVAIIGRRLNTSANDWFYEVIYPVNFTGDFLTM